MNVLTEEECKLELDIIFEQLDLTVTSPIEFDYDTGGYQCTVLNDEYDHCEKLEEEIDNLHRDYYFSCHNIYSDLSEEMIGIQVKIFKFEDEVVRND